MSADPISTANAAVAQITGAIRNAARAVGTSFSYLMATAKAESNFNPGAKLPRRPRRVCFSSLSRPG